jgi:hypothetical protein
VSPSDIGKAQSPGASGWPPQTNVDRAQTPFFAVIIWQIEHLSGATNDQSLIPLFETINAYATLRASGAIME